jgi:2'-5' RNA ligase
MASTEFTLWLTPQEPLRSALRAIIRRLARDLEAVEFEPHVTIFCGRSNDQEAQATARAIAGRFPPIHLEADRLAYTATFTKTLFVQFRESRAAREMFEAARIGYAATSNYALNPHLSLAYKMLPEARQKGLCETLRVPMGAYAFDRIRMIETETPIEDSGPVLRWREVCDVALSGL